jgi:hypothetical protein
LLDVLYPILINNNDLLTFIHYSQVGAQSSMYHHFLKYFGYESEWISFIDLDEYIRLSTGANIGEFIRNYSSEFDSIQLNWLNYGTSGYAERPKGSVLRNYRFRSKLLDIHTKHITKSDSIYRVGVTGPFWHSIDSNAIATCNVKGERHSFFNLLHNPKAAINHEKYLENNSNEMIELGCIAHYVLKSEEDFLRRINRSLKGDFSNKITYLKYINDLNARAEYVNKLNEIEDFHMLKYWQSLTDLNKKINLYFV